ncbi:NUDIX hydrolase [Mesorhizobium sp. 8]|uniref:NUDIX domain-containing protein n=1 Tax=Mesorhizobium sp. 8 TaxID=2584466 RepID=UPI00111ECEBD|nr:NUDIX hydrolase [Mesorhizobium sp. 8]QDB99783.1 NUDIX hydrolase [Mesorhizobium sp. 8]
MVTAETARRIQELERLAARILALKRRVRPRRPIVIEFSGSPKSGKTSALNSLDIFLRRNGFRTRVLTERASVCPIPNKFDPVFNVWTGCAALNQLMDTIANNALRVDVIIMDRGFFDALCWFEWQRNSGLLRKDDYERFTNFFLAPRFRMVIDLVLAFDSSPATSIEREYRNLLTRKEGSVMRKEVLTSYREIVAQSLKKYEQMFRQVTMSNTDDKSQDEVSYDITKLTLEKLRGIADERIGHIPKAKISSSLSSVFRYDEIRDAVEDSMAYAEREAVEHDGSVLQLLPVAVIKQRGESRILVGRKAEKAVSAKSPERKKTLGYFGGHVREEDSNFLTSKNNLEVLRQCLYREVKEEIGIDIDPSENNPHCIWVRDGTRSENHLAVVFVIEKDLQNTRVTVDGEEMVRYEKKGVTGTGAILSVSEILKREKIDSWTKNILEKIIGSQNTEDAYQKGLF